MKKAYVVEGSINDDGDIHLDEPAPPGFHRVLVTIIPIDEQTTSEEHYTGEQHAEVMAQIAAVAVLPGTPPPHDGLSAKDYKAILYGPINGQNDVR